MEKNEETENRQTRDYAWLQVEACGLYEARRENCYARDSILSESCRPPTMEEAGQSEDVNGDGAAGKEKNVKWSAF